MQTMPKTRSGGFLLYAAPEITPIVNDCGMMTVSPCGILSENPGQQ
jgi:hypothetical protein